MPDTFVPNDTPPNDGDDSQNQSPTTSFKIGDREYDQDAVVTKITSQDTYIEELKTKAAERDVELESLREKVAQAKGVEDVLDRINQQQKPDGGDTTLPNTDELLQQVEGRLEERAAEKLKAEQTADAERIRKETFESTQQKLLEKFGADNVDAEIAKVIPVATAYRMAADPELSVILLKQLNIKPPAAQPAPEDHSTNRSQSPNNNPEPFALHRKAGRKRTEAYRDAAAALNTPEKLAELRETWG